MPSEGHWEAKNAVYQHSSVVYRLLFVEGLEGIAAPASGPGRVVAPVHQVQAVLRKALQLGHLQRGLSGPC